MYEGGIPPGAAPVEGVFLEQEMILNAKGHPPSDGFCVWESLRATLSCLRLKVPMV